ncbi:hypothetical protein G5I_00634 [Acromyrmex echinatior]|uniref:Uncharacterized protein n=1 Tax=Acromyrmex echinatior TaxID=103372 RepID=F4W5D8_ACREC|nr:hypothetical protein G5I_00634 [Acromyrmex echinatior]
MNQIRASREGFLPKEESRKREAVGGMAPYDERHRETAGTNRKPRRDCRSYDPRKVDHDYQNREINVTKATKWEMDGLGTELTALYAFLERASCQATTGP